MKGVVSLESVRLGLGVGLGRESQVGKHGVGVTG